MTERDLETELMSLGQRDVDPLAMERIRSRALQAFHERRAPPWPTLLRAALEPAFSTGVVGTYLVWMAWTLAGMMR